MSDSLKLAADAIIVSGFLSANSKTVSTEWITLPSGQQRLLPLLSQRHAAGGRI